MNEDKELEEAIEILSKFMNNEIQRDKLERDSRCSGWKIGDVYKHFELNQAIKIVLQALKNSIPKDIVRQKINEREFELQQEYEDFKDDIRLNTLQELYYYKED